VNNKISILDTCQTLSRDNASNHTKHRHSAFYICYLLQHFNLHDHSSVHKQNEQHRNKWKLYHSKWAADRHTTRAMPHTI